jgi:hypothetical protein
MILHPTPARSGRFALPALPRLSADPLATALGRRLDDSFHFLRSVAPDGIEPVEVVVVGPGGTWAISTTDLHGRFRKRNGHWYRWNRSTESWIPWDARPISAARMAGHRLGLWLERASLPGTVEACLAAAHHTEIDWEPAQRPGLHVYTDADRLAKRIVRDEVLTPAQVDRIVEVLDPRRPVRRLAPSPGN